MSFSTFQIYLRAFFPHIPLWHWVVLGAISLAAAIVSRNRLSVYRAIVLGFAVFMGLYLLDALALVRIGSYWEEYPGLDLKAEVLRITSGNEENLMLMLFNTAVFIPIGIVLTEFLIISGLGLWRSLGWVVLIGFGLSLCIEGIQLVFHIGVFEVTDLVMNTVGTSLGAGIVLLFRSFLRLQMSVQDEC